MSGKNQPLSTTLRAGESRDPLSVKIVSPILRGLPGLSSVTSAMARLVALRRLCRFNAQLRTERQILARWIDENLDYGPVCFFRTLWSVNVHWHKQPERRVDS